MARARQACLLGGLVLCSMQLARGRITDALVRKDDRPNILIASPFGFSVNGHLDLEVSQFQFWHEGASAAPVDFSHLGFFLTATRDEAQLELDLQQVLQEFKESNWQVCSDLQRQGTCALDADNVYTLLTFDEVEELLQEGRPATVSNTTLAKRIPEFAGGEFSVFFANCQEQLMVSYDIRASLYNVKGGVKDYLSVGEDVLPTLYMVMFVLFSVAACLWGLLLWRKKTDVHRIHHLMTVLVAFKAATLLSQAGMYHLIRATGHPDGWNVAFYIFTFCRGILFFTVVVLVGTGWSYMKPLLANKEKKILMVVIPLQVCAEVAIIILDTNTPASRSFFTWRDILHLVDIICCCAILFPIVWSIKHLREASQTDGKAARSLVKLQLFQQFYVILISYIYVTRIICYLLASTFSYRLSWLSVLVSEAATLAFYAVSAYKFRPASENQYLALAENDVQMQDL